MDEQMDEAALLAKKTEDDIAEINSFISVIINTIRSRPEAQNLVKSWIKGQSGKIIAWKIATEDWEENYHLILTPNDVHLRDWEYPAFDVMMIGSPNTINKIILGKFKISTALRERRVMVWGNLNEGITFQKIIMEIKNL